MQDSFWLDRSVLVTGCTGLLGSWLVNDLVSAGAKVVGLMRDRIAGSNLERLALARRIDRVDGEVQDLPLMERVMGEYEVQTVFHLAAQTIVGVANRNPCSTFDTNIRGTWCVLEAARRSPAIQSVVVASSDKAYGEQEELPYCESAPLEGRHPYDASKSCADLLALTYFNTYRLPVSVTRCGNLYGGGDLNWNRIVPGTIRSVLRGQPPVIRSDGNFVRDYFYVKDGARAYLSLAERMQRDPAVIGHAFNFSNELQLTVLELTRQILGRMDSKLEPEVLNQGSNEIRRQYLSAAKARDILGWKPTWSLEKGLDETIAWYREYFRS